MDFDPKYDAWLLAIEIAIAELKEGWNLSLNSEEFWETHDFFSDWRFEIVLNRNLRILFRR